MNYKSGNQDSMNLIYQQNSSFESDIGSRFVCLGWRVAYDHDQHGGQVEWGGGGGDDV